MFLRKKFHKVLQESNLKVKHGSSDRCKEACLFIHVKKLCRKKGQYDKFEGHMQQKHELLTLEPQTEDTRTKTNSNKLNW